MLDIKVICDTAVENILRDGALQPLLVVETEQDIAYIAIPDMPQNRVEKHFNFWLMGAVMYEQYRVPLVSLTFVSEVWMVIRTDPDDVPQGSFEDEPDRTEAVMVTQYEVATKQLTGQFYDIVRNGDLLDLVEHPMLEATQLESALIDQFIKGYNTHEH
jgi:hypothetical protein